MTEVQETIIERVRKLLALSTSSNPNEAASALAKAQKLLLEYNLDMSLVEAKANGPDMSYEAHTVATGAWVWQKTLLNVIAKNNLCYVLGIPNTDACHLIGKAANIEVVVELFKHIKGQLEAMAVTAYKLSGSATPASTWKDSFYMGANRAIEVRLQAERAAQEAASNSMKALIVRTDDEIKQAITRIFPNMHIRSGRQKSVRSTHGYQAGKEAGKRVTFRREIE